MEDRNVEIHEGSKVEVVDSDAPLHRGLESPGLAGVEYAQGGGVVADDPTLVLRQQIDQFVLRQSLGHLGRNQLESARSGDRNELVDHAEHRRAGHQDFHLPFPVCSWKKRAATPAKPPSCGVSMSLDSNDTPSCLIARLPLRRPVAAE